MSRKGLDSGLRWETEAAGCRFAEEGELKSRAGEELSFG